MDFPRISEVLGLPTGVFNFSLFESSGGEGEGNPWSRPPAVALAIALVVVVLPAAAVLFSQGGTKDPSSSSAKSRLIGWARARVSKQWVKTWKNMMLFVPYFIPRSHEATQTLALNLVGMVTCILVSRAINLIQPLLLRYVVDSLSAPLTSVETATAAGQDEGGSSSFSNNVFSIFPWQGIVAYVLVSHVGVRMMGNLEWSLQREIFYEAADRITIAAYSHLMALGSDYHESTIATDKVSGGGGSATAAWVAICNSSPAVARFIANTVFSLGPSILDLLLGLVAFWRVSGGAVAGAMALMLLVYLSALFLLEDNRRAAFTEEREARTVRANLASDATHNWFTIALFAREDHEKERFGRANAKLREVERRRWGPASAVLGGSHQAATQLVLVGGLLGLGLVAGWQIRLGRRSVGDFVMLMHYWAELVSNVRSLLSHFIMMDEFVVDADKLVAIFEREPSIRDKEDAPDLDLQTGAIEFDNVTFSYPGAKKPALDGASFSVRGGQTVAVVGETGGGKSTLLKLLCRMRDVSSGAVRIDGQDVRDVRRASLLSHVAIVPQIIELFGASVADNVRYGRLDASDAEVEAACVSARLHTKITTGFRRGYAEKVGPSGATRLSGGEAQRLAIARALIRGGGGDDSSQKQQQQARIVLFDEAMSSLDAETEWEIQRAVRAWCRGRTVVIISHRLATVAHADLILAVKDGRIVESGTQEELLKKGGYYHSLWTKQKLQE